MTYPRNIYCFVVYNKPKLTPVKKGASFVRRKCGQAIEKLWNFKDLPFSNVQEF